MADKGKGDSSNLSASGSDSEDNSDNEKNDPAIPSIPPLEPEENGEDVSEAIERFLEQVAASNSTNRDDPSKSKDKEREVKRASKMIIPPECKCHLNNGRPCHTRFSVAELMDTRMHYMTISKKELDIAVLAKLECGIHLSRMTTRKKRKPTERKKHRTDFYHRGYRICNLIFVYLHGFSYKKLKALIIQYKTNGVKTRIHKNLKPKPLDGEKKLKKKKLKPKPKPKEPKEKKPRVKKTKETKTKAEEKKDKNAPEFRPMAVSQPKPVVPQAMTHTQLPPPPSVHPSVTFPIPSQHNPPHPPAFPITAKHNPTPAFPHTVSVSYNNPPVFPHHPMAGHHPHPHPVVSSHNNPPLDYSNQRGMSNPPLDFSNQRNNPNNLAVFSGTNPHGLTYSVPLGHARSSSAFSVDCPEQFIRPVVQCKNTTPSHGLAHQLRRCAGVWHLEPAHFAQISRTLGVMWQCLPKKEKMMWRRKSKKLAGKGSTLISTGKGSKKESAVSASVVGPAMNQPSMRNLVPSKSTKSGSAATSTPTPVGDDMPQSPVKGFGIEPIDIAAHLKLLGESLSIIGMRLQEHKGLIAVQGSLSVLLDSLLCACGPLMALTQQVPGLDGCSEATHARTLDSVAYIMPGL
ncbi:hypothetical protein BaRGS_00023543 [Batillaria attramentaria]|uniref:HMG box domain-containing protein n=1 Tax=Batillaria attramentaria TaxID=370345 RepID=A0ABD0KE19_9CAEN